MGVLDEVKWLPVAVAAIVGIGLMFVLGIAFHVDTFGMLLGIGFICYFVTGLIAGAWANWKGYQYGGFAATLVWLGNLIYSLAIGTPSVDLSHPFWSLLGVFMAGLFALGIGALGGFVGDRIRNWKQQKK